MRILRGGTTLPSLNVLGAALFADASAGSPGIARTADPTTGVWFDSGPTIYTTVSGASRTAIDVNNFTVFGLAIALRDSGGNNPAILVRDAANILALKNSTAAQELRVYGSTTGPIYTRLLHDGTNAQLFNQGNAALYLGTNNLSSHFWLVGGSVNNYALSTDADNVIDIGLAAARVRSGYFGTSLNIGIATNALGQFYFGGNAQQLQILETASATATAAGSSDIAFRKSRGTQASRSDANNGDVVGLIEWQAYSSGYQGMAIIQSVLDGTFTTGQRPPSRLEFYTNIANAAQTLNLKLSGNGDLFHLGSNFWMTGKVASYNNVTTNGYGVAPIYAHSRAAGQTAAFASLTTYTPTVDGSFEVSANVLVTTATTHAFTVTCTYTDEGNTSRTLTLSFTLVAGSAIVTSIANANGAVPYHGISAHIRVKANTAITLQTVGTFTTVTYNVEGTIKQLA